MANMKETKATITGVLEKLKKSIDREDSYKKELENDKATLAYIQDLMDSGESLPPENPYGSFADWSEAIQKQIKTTETSIKRIGVEKDEIFAFEYFLKNAPEDDTQI